MIQIASSGDFSILTLSGRIKGEDVATLEQLIQVDCEGRNIVLDLKEVRLIDRDVVRFLARCESRGARIENCPLYIRDWIIGETTQWRPK